MELCLRLAAGVLLIVLGFGLFGLAVLHAAQSLSDGPVEKPRRS